MNYTIYLPAINRTVSLPEYMAAIKLAKANPDREFKHTLETWYPGTGKRIVEQFVSGLHDRINSRPNNTFKSKLLTGGF